MRRARQACSARARTENRCARLSRDGLTASAAAVGVEARTSATMSAMDVSGSCPMPVTTGTGHAAIARASASSLKGMRSSNEPPPRTTSTTSAPTAHTLRMPSTMPAGAPAPSTGTPATSTRASGKRRRSVRSTSWTAAPRGEVTRPMEAGSCGSARLRAASMSPSACSLLARLATWRRRLPSPASATENTSKFMRPFGAYSVNRPVSSTSMPTESDTPAAW